MDDAATEPAPKYWYLADQLNRLIDQGQSIPVGEVQERIEDRSLFDQLEELYRGDPHRLDIAIISADEREEMLNAFGSMANAHEIRQFGIAHNGLGLCLAYCLHKLQPHDLE